VETKTSSAGEQLVRDTSNRRNKFKSVATKVTLFFVFNFRGLCLKKRAHKIIVIDFIFLYF